jgi:hypothetical protein
MLAIASRRFIMTRGEIRDSFHVHCCSEAASDRTGELLRMPLIPPANKTGGGSVRVLAPSSIVA